MKKNEEQKPEIEPLRETLKSLKKSLSDAANSLEVLSRSEVEKDASETARTVTKIENHWLTRVTLIGGGIAASLGIILTTFFFYLERNVWSEERKSRQEEALFRHNAEIASAWSVLLQRAGGNIGKANALETILFDSGRILGVDLSCKNIGQFDSGRCSNPPIFDFHNAFYFMGDPKSRLTVNPETQIWENGFNWKLSEVNFSDSELINFTVQSGTLENVRFDGALLKNLNLSDVITEYDDVHDIGRFSCESCALFGESSQRYDWQFVSGFSDSSISNTVIVFPKDSKIFASQHGIYLESVAAGMNIPLFGKTENRSTVRGWIALDHLTRIPSQPPLFLKSDTSKYAPYGELLASPAKENIFWDLYHVLYGCGPNFIVPKDDADFLSCLSSNLKKDLRTNLSNVLDREYQDDWPLFYSQNKLGEPYLVSYDCNEKFDLNNAEARPPSECFRGDGFGY